MDAKDTGTTHKMAEACKGYVQGLLSPMLRLLMDGRYGLLSQTMLKSMDKMRRELEEEDGNQWVWHVN